MNIFKMKCRFVGHLYDGVGQYMLHLFVCLYIFFSFQFTTLTLVSFIGIAFLW
jgi:hypothetical protein